MLQRGNLEKGGIQREGRTEVGIMGLKRKKDLKRGGMTGIIKWKMEEVLKLGREE